jgi:hypothetical protein
MNSKATQKELTSEQLNTELKAINAIQSSQIKNAKLRELSRAAAGASQWDLAAQVFQWVKEDDERNLLIADLIEDFLLPTHNYKQAKQFAKFMTEGPETQSLVLLRIALAEGKGDQAKEIAEHLPTPLSRNFAFMQIAEFFHLNRDKAKVQEISKLMLDNVKTILNAKIKSYILREIAINLHLGNNDREHAKEAALLIPDEAIRTGVLNKLQDSKQSYR